MNYKTILMFAIGYGMGIISVVQWLFLYPDPSQFLLGMLLGAAFIFLASYRDALEYLLQKVDSIEHRLDSLVYAKKSEQELKAVKRRKK